jgi:NTE family protein
MDTVKDSNSKNITTTITKKYKNVYFSAGGLKGFCYLGVMKYLEMNNITFDNYYGTSVGAFSCLLLILGYTYKELKGILLEFNFETLIEHSFENLLDRKGLCDGIKFNNFIKIFIKNKGYDPEITLQEFYKKTNKLLTVTGCNITKEKTIYISKDTYPDLPVWKAIRISCNIPFVFQPVLIDNEYFIDGFLMDECCLDFFKTPDDIQDTLCFVLEKDNYNKPDTFVEYMMTIVRLPIKYIKVKSYLFMKDNGYNIIIIKTPPTDSVSFKISKELKLALLNLGYKHILNFFQELKIRG